MNNTVLFLSLILWSIGAYFIAKKTKEKHPNFNINPSLYGLGTFFLGFIWTMLFLVIKFSIWNSKNN